MPSEDDASSLSVTRRSSRWWVVGGLLLVAAGAVAFRLRLDKPDALLRAVPVEISLSADDPERGGTLDQRIAVTLINDGRRPLRVVHVQTSCTCTVAQAPPAAPLAPGRKCWTSSSPSGCRPMASDTKP